MEFLLLLLLPLLGSVLGDSAEDDDDLPADEPDGARQAASHESDDPDEERADSAEDEATGLPGGDADDQDAPPPDVVTVDDFDGGKETLTLQVDEDLLRAAKGAELTAKTDAESGDIMLALAGHDIALLTQPRGFDLSLVTLEAA